MLRKNNPPNRNIKAKTFKLLVVVLCISVFISTYQLQHVEAANINPLSSVCPLLDVDSNGKLEAFVDGLLITRIINTKASSDDIPTTTRSFILVNKMAYDIDEDSILSPSIDGLLITRYLLGMQSPGIFDGMSPTLNDIKQQKVIQNLNILCSKIVSTSTTELDINTDIKPTDQMPGDEPDTAEIENVCVDLKSDMKFKARDENTSGGVSELQDFLGLYGYFLSEPSGYFGKSTVTAVKSFQSANGLIASGIVGPYTREKVKSISCSDSPVKAVDDGIDKKRTQVQIIKSSPRAQVRIIDQVPAILTAPVTPSIKTIPIKLSSLVFFAEPVILISDNFTLKIKALVSSDTEYMISIYYKNTNRTCILSSGFTPTSKQTYTIDRTIYSICKNGNTVSDFSTIDYIAIEKKQ